MRLTLLPIAALVTVLAACAPADDAAETRASNDQSTPSAEASTTPSESTDGAEAVVVETVAAPRALDCVPGTWAADMPSFVSTFRTPGDPTYVSGTYTFTFARDSTEYTAVGDDVTFRLTDRDGYVDVHNSWEETGLWGAASDAVTFEEASVIVGSGVDLTKKIYAPLKGRDESELVALGGTIYRSIEAYGMVNGSMRTPPLSDEGAAIMAGGFVDCDAGAMTLIVNQTGWKGEFTLTKVSD